MGSGADLIATRLGVSREACDAVAHQSQQRAAQAQREGRFRSIIAIETSRGWIDQDECVP